MSARTYKLGTCTKCRTRTAVHPCKVEAFAGDARAVETELCEPCEDTFKVAKVTRLAGVGETLTELYQ